MKRLALIVVYFGKLPSMFKLWLKTCEYNKEVDFYVITNDQTDYLVPENVYIVHEEVEDFEKRVFRELGIRCKLNGRIYKTCDYRPLFNIIYKDVVGEYEYVGQCELDMLFGRISDFVDWNLMKKYKKLFNYGHLTIYKNDNFLLNNMDIKFGGGMTYRQLLEKEELCNSDEQFHPYSINLLYDRLEEKIYEDGNIYIADVAQEYYQFRLVRHLKRKIKKDGKCNQIFAWRDGKLFDYECRDGKLLKQEYIYIHLQKRVMEIEENDEIYSKGFLIVPNSIIPYQEINYRMVKEKSKNKLLYKQFFKTHWNGVQLRINRFMYKDYASCEVGVYKKRRNNK